MNNKKNVINIFLLFTDFTSAVTYFVVYCKRFLQNSFLLAFFLYYIHTSKIKYYCPMDGHFFVLLLFEDRVLIILEILWKVSAKQKRKNGKNKNEKK